MTEQELRDKADGILAAIGQPALTQTEFMALVCMPHSDSVEFFNSLGTIVNKRSGNGDAVLRLREYAAFNGVDMNLKKSVPNNVFLGCVL